MTISTYAELKTAIANFLARDDLTATIPTFIQLAEGRMSRELETREQEKRATTSLTSGDQYVTLPVDLREVRSVKLNTNPVKVLSYYSPTSLDASYGTDAAGRPEGYSIVGAEMKVRPIPDSAYEMEILYVGTLPAISDSVTPTLFTRSKSRRAKSQLRHWFVANQISLFSSRFGSYLGVRHGNGKRGYNIFRTRIIAILI